MQITVAQSTNLNLKQRVGGARFLAALAAVAFCAMAFFSLETRAVRADEFAVVPAKDALYRHLATVAAAGWTGDRGTGGATASTLTRYEFALETAKAVIAVRTRYEANPDWARSAPKPAAKALRELARALPGELKSLGIDAGASARLCDQIIQYSVTVKAALKPVTGTTKVSIVPKAEAPDAKSVVPGRSAPNRLTQRGEMQDAALRLSERLWASTALSALQSESRDPLNNGRFSLQNRVSSVSRSNVALSLNQRLTLRAMYNRLHVLPGTTFLPLSSTVGTRALNSVGGALDFSPMPGMTLSGSVENMAADEAPLASWKRYSGGVGFSAWQDRLSLQANLSRLVPNDVRALPSTMAGVGVGLDVNERVSLSLLYQQLFTATAPTQADRVVSGGLNIHF